MSSRRGMLHIQQLLRQLMDIIKQQGESLNQHKMSFFAEASVHHQAQKQSYEKHEHVRPTTGISVFA